MKTARMRNRMAGLTWLVVAACMVMIIVSSGCAGENASDAADTGTLADKTELFDRRYSYLLRGDEDFPTLTTRYKMKTGIGEDIVAQVGLIVDPEQPTDGDDSCQVFKITLKQESSIMVVVADSIGSGLVSFDFGVLPPGEYTLGSGKFPPELAGWTNDCKRLVISLALGDSIRHRARWSVSEHCRLVHLLDF